MLRRGNSSPPSQAIAPVKQGLGLTAWRSKSAPIEPPPSIRTSLRASTLDGVFAAIFAQGVGGALLNNFFVDLKASAVEIGIVAAIPMLVNLLQPLGAYFSQRAQSRHLYGLRLFGIARLLWLFLAVAGLTWNPDNLHLLIYVTLAVALISGVLGALGSASWFSWMAVLVPRQLRGRYFGFRNSAVSLTTLIWVPLAGWGVSNWPGGSIQGYGVVLMLGVAAGMWSLICQFWIRDVNPQALRSPTSAKTAAKPELELGLEQSEPANFCRDRNFLMFLAYLGCWTLAVNLSAPFFNIYLLDNLGLDIWEVSLYNSLMAAANLLMLILWGKLSDRTGNGVLLLLVGILVALTPLLWLEIGTDPLSLWLWLPLLYVLIGSTMPAIELCTNNLQIAIAAPQQQATYFGIAAAIAGASGALGTIVGGGLAAWADSGGLPGIFALSSLVRLAALLPLIFVQEPQRQPLTQLRQALNPMGLRLKPLSVRVLGSANRMD